MTIHIEQPFNYFESATLHDPIQLNASTSTKILDANPERGFLYISNTSLISGIFIKLQSANVDDIKKGIWLPKSESWSPPAGVMPKGEICAIAEVDSPVITVTEA
jgi:hypothetical protein